MTATNYYQNLALAYETKSDFGQALTTWQKILSLNPSHLKATQKISWLQTDVARNFVESGEKLHKEGKVKEAVESYEQALILNPQQPMPIYRNFGNNLITLGRFEEAEATFQQFIKLYPNQPSGYEGYARVTNSLMNWELALKRWSEAVVKFPDNISFQVQKGNVLINLSRFDEAEAVFQRLKEKHPNHPSGYEGYARVAHSFANRQLALTRWQTAIDKFPNNLAFLLAKANTYIQLHEFDSAQDLADRIFHQYPNHHRQKYDLQKNIVLRWYPLKRLSKVEDYFKSLLSESEVFPITHPCHQILLESINSFAEVITNSTTPGLIGIAVKRLLDDYFLEVSPGEILACTFQRLIAQKLGNKNLDLIQANKFCSEADFSPALNIYLNLGDEIVEKFIPDYPEHIDRLFFQLGETKKGLAYLKKQVEMSFYSQNAYIELGYTLLKIGQKESAFANYKQAVKLSLAFALLGATLIEWVSSKYQQLVNSGCQKLGVYQQFSDLLIKQGLSNEALEVAHKVQTKFGDGYHSKKVLISILAAQGNKQQALEYHQQVLKENPKYADKNLDVLRTCYSLEKFENSTLSWVMLCDRFKVAYAIIPKSACTTIRNTMQWLQNGGDNDSKIIKMVNHQSPKEYWLQIENLAANYCKLVVVREPIKRFLSGFSDLILSRRIAFEKNKFLTSCEYLSLVKLGNNPEINWLIENLELYLEMSYSLKFHIKPQHTFMGNQIKGFDRIFQVERLGELGKKLSEMTGFEITLPRLNTGGRKVSLAELSEKSMKKLIDFYARDYELLHEYYSPAKIWEEYKSLKK